MKKNKQRADSIINSDLSKPKYRPTPGCPDWKAMVRVRLQAGYGVEDIAVHLSCRISCVREYVKAMRQLGELAGLFGEPS